MELKPTRPPATVENRRRGTMQDDAEGKEHAVFFYC